MYDLETLRPAEDHAQDKGRGSRFFAVDRDVWENLWTVETQNRLHLVIAFLVLSAGTGSDHRLTKWSAKAIEDYVGIGKPRGQRAIQELVDHGIVARTAQSTRLFPHYRLPGVPKDADPIFLPVQLITGLRDETPILRRLREIGDPFALRMLVDLYGLVQVDATYAPAVAHATLKPSAPARRLFETGIHAVWALDLGNIQEVNGDWTAIHLTEGKEAWQTFWARFETLKAIGAMMWETWVFDGPSLDAEPLFPLVPGSDLRRQVHEAVLALVGTRHSYLNDAGLSSLVPLAMHHRAPQIRGVLKLRVEADTPGRRLAFAQRMERIAAYGAGFSKIIKGTKAAGFSGTMRVYASDARMLSRHSNACQSDPGLQFIIAIR